MHEKEKREGNARTLLILDFGVLFAFYAAHLSALHSTIILYA